MHVPGLGLKRFCEFYATRTIAITQDKDDNGYVDKHSKKAIRKLDDLAFNGCFNMRNETINYVSQLKKLRTYRAERSSYGTRRIDLLTRPIAENSQDLTKLDLIWDTIQSSGIVHHNCQNM